MTPHSHVNVWFSTRLPSTLLIILALLAGCERTQPVRPGKPVVPRVEGHAEVRIGPRTTKVLGAPTRVRAYRVLSPFTKNFEAFRKTKPLIDVYPILAEAPVQAETAREIARILLDPDSYDPSFAMACLFEPGHALRFERDSDVVDVVICFKCDDLDIVPAKALAENRTRQPFGRIAEPLYRTIREIFPEPIAPLN